MKSYKMKRCIVLLCLMLLCTGCGNVDVANPDTENSAAEKDTEGNSDKDQTGVELSQTMEFPISIEEGKLLIETVFQYSGINFDCQEELCEDIGAVQIKNTSEQYLERADVKVKLISGTEFVFRVEDVPAGKTIIAFDIANTVFNGKRDVKEAAADVVWQENVSLNEEQLRFRIEGTEINVENISNEVMEDLTLKYHCYMDDMYFGGKSYEGKIDVLEAEESVLLDALECYLGEAAVVRVIH